MAQTDGPRGWCALSIRNALFGPQPPGAFARCKCMVRRNGLDSWLSTLAFMGMGGALNEVCEASSSGASVMAEIIEDLEDFVEAVSH